MNEIINVEGENYDPPIFFFLTGKLEKDKRLHGTKTKTGRRSRPEKWRNIGDGVRFGTILNFLDVTCLSS